MKERKPYAAQRLQFTSEEAENEGQEKPIADRKKAASKAKKARRKLPKRMVLKKEAVEAQSTASAASRVHTSEGAISPDDPNGQLDLAPDGAAPDDASPIADCLLTRSKAGKAKAGRAASALKPGDPPKPKCRLTFEEAPNPRSPVLSDSIVKPITAAAREEATNHTQQN